MEFYEDGDYIVSTWHPTTHYQGWVNTMHGGILSTLIDEVSLLKQATTENFLLATYDSGNTPCVT